MTNKSSCSAPATRAEFLIEMEVDALDITILNPMRNVLMILSLLSMNRNINITEMNITTVCRLIDIKYQCRCEDQYFMPCEKCTVYESCDDVTNALCGCINALPNTGNFCQPISELANNSTCPAVTPTAEYLFEVELGAVDITILNPVGILSATSDLTVKKSNITITKMNITTVCSMNGTVHQCRCEDQYFWPCEKCTVYGSCDDVSNISCGCISVLPNDGHLCQPLTEMTNKSSCSDPATRAEFLIEMEVDALDITILNPMRNVLMILSLLSMKRNINITEMNITTVCSLIDIEYQCRCEDQYFWPCEKCTVYEACDDVTNALCGCINALPNTGNFCQPISELANNATCPAVTPTAEYLFEVELGAVDITILNPVGILSVTSDLTVKNSYITITKMNITTVCSMNGTVYQCRCEDQYFWPCEKCTVYGSCDDVSNISCGCINVLPNNGHLCQPLTEMTTEFLIEMEVDALDMTILNPMRNILMTLSLFSMNSNINITEINITTVCSLIDIEYQCRCEDQYFWPWEKCTVYESCDDVTNALCGCINALPNTGNFCQPISKLPNNSTCPAVTPTVPTILTPLTQSAEITANATAATTSNTITLSTSPAYITTSNMTNYTTTPNTSPAHITTAAVTNSTTTSNTSPAYIDTAAMTNSTTTPTTSPAYITTAAMTNSTTTPTTSPDYITTAAMTNSTTTPTTSPDYITTAAMTNSTTTPTTSQAT
ncbi:uncharacterized protein LOC124393064 isoform X2 [Silurus meridionalis]|uniref:uncharacterized protein LOC124393064 isoform X2 n=1 Tax=Silurus meridionalis TaxID=175797 RepID=UPI001EEC6CDD|nr:uncharacterized protein LOC124393064 isoform X2 [Silurus meridionalis]